MKQVTILTDEPIIEVIADMMLDWEGIRGMARWVKSHRPECLPDGYDPDREGDGDHVDCLFPHDLREGERLGERRLVSHNELLAELAGRKCYDSFGLKAGRKTNKEYIEHTQMLTDPVEIANRIGFDRADNNELRRDIAAAIQAERDRVPHASIVYHAKMSFFIAGVSRRVSHELIRNYVGADRDEEGSPSQESTRFTHHYGYYVAPPRMLRDHAEDAVELTLFRAAMQKNYDAYLHYVQREFLRYGGDPKGMERKRIYESASAFLSHACETSFIWTTNPGALMKLFKERDNEFADAEFQRFAKKWKRVCLERWPNLFPGVKP